MMRHRSVRQFATARVALMVLGAVAACGGQPTLAPTAPTSIDEKLSWILRLENQRVLRDPADESVGVATDATAAGVSEAGALGGGLPGAAVSRPDLAILLSDPDRQLRRRAALAIGRVGLSDGVDLLVGALADPEVEVRQVSAFALGLLGQPRATPALRMALSDPAAIVQGRAAEALARLGDTESADAIGQLAARHVTSAFGLDPEDQSFPLTDEAETFRLAIYALGELKAYEPLAAAILQDDGQPLLWWWPVAYALQATEDPRALDALVTLARVQGSVGVAFAAQGLGRLGLPDPRAIDVLDALLDRERGDDDVAFAAVQALGQIDDPRAAGALRAFALRPTITDALRAEALDALAHQSDVVGIDLFEELISARWPYLRAAAIRGLARTSPDTLLLVLSSLPPDADWRVRAAVAEGLSFASRDIAEYRLKLVLADPEEDRRVIPAVLRSLASHEVADLVPLLLEQLDHEDVVVRKTAAQLLSTAGPLDVAARGSLVTAFEQAEFDSSYLARAAILETLVVTSNSELTPDVRAVYDRALGDSDWAVRRKAAELLEEREGGGDLHERIRPAPGRRAVDFSADHLIWPLVSPHVFIETDGGTIELELAVIDAPIVADNFTMLARRGFYDGLSFHRVIGNYVVQGGDPRGDSEGGPGYTVRDELSPLPFLRGTVGLALDWGDTGGSQFFITRSPQPQLDGRYTVFARVVTGMDVIDQLLPGAEIHRMWVWDGEESSE